MNKVIQQVRCLVGLHRHSRSRIQFSTPKRRSICRGCGQPMVQDSGHWHVDKAA